MGEHKCRYCGEPYDARGRTIGEGGADHIAMGRCVEVLRTRLAVAEARAWEATRRADATCSYHEGLVDVLRAALTAADGEHVNDAAHRVVSALAASRAEVDDLRHNTIASSEWEAMRAQRDAARSDANAREWERDQARDERDAARAEAERLRGALWRAGKALSVAASEFNQIGHDTASQLAREAFDEVMSALAPATEGT